MRQLAFDIETMADPEMVATMPPPDKAPANYKDPEKIRVYLAEAAEKQRAQAALDPYFGRVLAIATATRENDDVLAGNVDMLSLHESIYAGGSAGQVLDHEEAGVLGRFWKTVEDADQIITFNGCGFDVPFLVQRSLQLRVWTQPIPTHRWECARISPMNPHLDLYLALQDIDVGPCHRQDLGHYVRRLLGEEKAYAGDEIDKSDLWGVWLSGRGELVAKIAAWDVQATLRLAEHLLEYVRFAG